MHSGPHHRSIRQRMYRNLEQFPHPKLAVRILDKAIFVTGFLGPALTLPQVYQIFAYQDASGVSVLTWSIYTAFAPVWILYGLAHREPVIVFTYSLWFFVNGAVAIGAYIYG